METFNAEVLRIHEVLAELTTKIQDGVCRLEILKAEARTQPSSFTAPSDPQEEIRRVRRRDSKHVPRLVPCSWSARGTTMSDVIDQADASWRNL